MMRMKTKLAGVSALMVCALLVIAVVPAAAKPDKKPPGKPSGLYDVTMTLSGPEGLATTTCGALLMEESPDGDLTAVGEASLQLEALIPWERNYPNPQSGARFTGCPDGSLDSSDDPNYDGLFRITRDTGSGTIQFLWHFDYYIEQETTCRPNGKGKCRTTQTVREHFTLTSDPIPFQGNSGQVTGYFAVKWYLNDHGDLIHQYDPFGWSTFSFWLDITAHSG